MNPHGVLITNQRLAAQNLQRCHSQWSVRIVLAKATSKAINAEMPLTKDRWRYPRLAQCENSAGAVLFMGPVKAVMGDDSTLISKTMDIRRRKKTLPGERGNSGT